MTEDGVSNQTLIIPRRGGFKCLPSSIANGLGIICFRLSSIYGRCSAVPFTTETPSHEVPLLIPSQCLYVSVVNDSWEIGVLKLYADFLGLGQILLFRFGDKVVWRLGCLFFDIIQIGLE
jgi:hypothetical protein